MSDALRSFLPRLLDGTRAGHVTWRHGPEGSFNASTPHGAISVAQFDDRGVTTTMQLLSPKGDVIDELKTDPSSPGPWLGWEETLMELYRLVEAEARGTRRVLNSLADDWDLPGEPGT